MTASSLFSLLRYIRQSPEWGKLAYTRLPDLRSIMRLGGIWSDRFNDPGRRAAPIYVWCHTDEARSSNSSLNIRCGECLMDAPNFAPVVLIRIRAGRAKG